MYHILLVEDEPILRQAMKSLIQWEKYHFEISAEAGNGLEACAVLKQRSDIDAVFTDIRMPQMDGIALARFIQKEYPGIYTVLLSAYSEFEYARQAIQHGVFEYLLKEDEHEKIYACLQKLEERIMQDRAGAGGQGEPDVSEEPEGEKNLPAGPYNQQLMNDAEAYIRSHYSEPLSLKKMADHYHITPSYFSRLFVQHTGKNYIDYLTHVRLEESMRLLQETDLKVYEIAERVGYGKARYFSELFRKECQMSPGEYRASHLRRKP